jgi:hypothetical protein
VVSCQGVVFGRDGAPTAVRVKYPPMTPISAGGETYPGQSLSASQLLYAVKRKLQDASSAGRFVRWSLSPYDASKVAYNRRLTELQPQSSNPR